MIADFVIADFVVCLAWGAVIAIWLLAWHDAVMFE